MDWKSTGIGAAIQAAKADNKLFVVFVHGLFVSTLPVTMYLETYLANAFRFPLRFGLLPQGRGTFQKKARRKNLAM